MNVKVAMIIFNIHNLSCMDEKLIKSRSKELIKKTHPDNGGTNIEMCRILEAKKCLLDYLRKGESRKIVSIDFNEYLRNYDNNIKNVGELYHINCYSEMYCPNLNFSIRDDFVVYVRPTKKYKNQFDVTLELDVANKDCGELVFNVSGVSIRISKPIGVNVVKFRLGGLLLVFSITVRYLVKER